MGIDVASTHVDVCVRPSDVTARFEYAEGGFEGPVAASIAAADIPVAVVNPRQVRDFARATGKLAKTNAIDASVLAHFAGAIRPEARPLADEETRELTALVTRRRPLVEMRTAEQARLRVCTARATKLDLKQHIAWLTKRIKDHDKDIGEAVRRSKLWREKDDLLRSIPGLGAAPRPLSSPRCQSSARSTVARLPPWSASRPSIATPANSADDARHGAGAAMTAPCSSWRQRPPSSTTPRSETATRRLVTAGKSNEVALVACMRRLLGIASAVLRDGAPWEPKEISS